MCKQQNSTGTTIKIERTSCSTSIILKTRTSNSHSKVRSRESSVGSCNLTFYAITFYIFRFSTTSSMPKKSSRSSTGKRLNNSSLGNTSTAPSTKMQRHDSSDTEANSDSTQNATRSSPEASDGSFNRSEVAFASSFIIPKKVRAGQEQAEDILGHDDLALKIDRALGISNANQLEIIENLQNVTLIEPPPGIEKIIRQRKEAISNEQSGNIDGIPIAQQQVDVSEAVAGFETPNVSLATVVPPVKGIYHSRAMNGKHMLSGWIPNVKKFRLLARTVFSTPRVAEAGKISFYPADYPNTVITEETKKVIIKQINLQVAAFERATERLDRNTASPLAFPTIIARHGQLLVGCLNAFTMNFLIRTFTNYDWRSNAAVADIRCSRTTEVATPPTYSLQAPLGTLWESALRALRRKYSYATEGWNLIHEATVNQNGAPHATKFIFLSQDTTVRDRMLERQFLEERVFMNASRDPWIIRYVPTEAERGEFRKQITMKVNNTLGFFQQQLRQLRIRETTSSRRIAKRKKTVCKLNGQTHCKRCFWQTCSRMSPWNKSKKRELLKPTQQQPPFNIELKELDQTRPELICKCRLRLRTCHKDRNAHWCSWKRSDYEFKCTNGEKCNKMKYFNKSASFSINFLESSLGWVIDDDGG